MERKLLSSYNYYLRTEEIWQETDGTIHKITIMKDPYPTVVPRFIAFKPDSKNYTFKGEEVFIESPEMLEEKEKSRFNNLNSNPNPNSNTNPNSNKKFTLAKTDLIQEKPSIFKKLASDEDDRTVMIDNFPTDIISDRESVEEYIYDTLGVRPCRTTICRDKNTGEPYGKLFVAFSTLNNARLTVQHLHRKLLENRVLSVKISGKKTKKNTYDDIAEIDVGCGWKIQGESERYY